MGGSSAVRRYLSSSIKFEQCHYLYKILNDDGKESRVMHLLVSQNKHIMRHQESLLQMVKKYCDES